MLLRRRAADEWVAPHDKDGPEALRPRGSSKSLNGAFRISEKMLEYDPNKTATRRGAVERIVMMDVRNVRHY